MAIQIWINDNFKSCFKHIHFLELELWNWIYICNWCESVKQLGMLMSGVCCILSLGRCSTSFAHQVFDSFQSDLDPCSSWPGRPLSCPCCTAKFSFFALPFPGLHAAYSPLLPSLLGEGTIRLIVSIHFFDSLTLLNCCLIALQFHPFQGQAGNWSRGWRADSMGKRDSYCSALPDFCHDRIQIRAVQSVFLFFF